MNYSSTDSGSGTIHENMRRILSALSRVPRNSFGEAWRSGEQLQKDTGLSPAEINDAVDLLEARGLVEWLQTMGSIPYMFATVTITSRGRYEIERGEVPSHSVHRATVLLPTTPVGSPYGFTDVDWGIVKDQMANRNQLRVVFGSPFQSDFFDLQQLRQNVRAMFQKAVDEYNQKPDAVRAELVFGILGAGYGEHLFNEITRDIISADIAVFDTSDFNPNVMIEMGVALTWGVKVLPIKAAERERPPSDVSGQTWADYRRSGAEWVVTDHHDRLASMVERAARKKRSG